MTLVFPIKADAHPNIPKNGLTIPDEAFRGISWSKGSCIIYVSDPRQMGVSQFRLSRGALAEIKEQNIRLPEDGEILILWLFKQSFLEVEELQCDGLPSMFAPFKTSGPGPSLKLSPPSVDR
ncbi:MAG TPA: hypothetical protein PKJ00_11290 [Verrucomicrobiota bacterium]|nr:hypothetical protein [Verrucomicrobiota bacterium]HNS69504.1 hypothetical protein [Verrucomicrobiota bacterium]